MTARKQIKKQHRLERERQQRSLGRTRAQRRLLGFGAATIVVAAAAAFAFAFAPWSGSGEAEETLPSLALAIGDNFFQPDTLTLKAGQKYRLEIRNQGLATHDFWAAGSDNKTETGDDIRTDPISAGGSATEKIIYENPGTYYFVCTFHAGQGGTLIVEAPVTPAATP